MLEYWRITQNAGPGNDSGVICAPLLFNLGDQLQTFNDSTPTELS
jgi:hypothetical protein